MDDEGRVFGDFGGLLPGGVEEGLGVGVDGVDEFHFSGVFGVEVGAGHGEASCGALADDVGQALEGAEVGGDGDFDFAQAELGLLGA